VTLADDYAVLVAPSQHHAALEFIVLPFSIGHLAGIFQRPGDRLANGAGRLGGIFELALADFQPVPGFLATEPARFPSRCRSFDQDGIAVIFRFPRKSYPQAQRLLGVSAQVIAWR
jgi:hypothetical protein